MRFWFQRKINHPFYPKLRPVPAASASGCSEALAGTYSELLAAARCGARATRMALVLHSVDTPFLNAVQRDRLWELFEVPIYAMVLDRKGSLAGFECEAQNGLHLPGRHGADSSVCPCGRPGLIQTEAAREVSAAVRLLPAGV
jgi:hypothetical protein